MNKYSPECPFCGRHIESPKNTRTGFGEVLGGCCGCGAAYVCDPTGRNAGEAYMEALALAKGDWEIGSMAQDVDYEVREMDYDLKKHARVYSKGLSDGAGKLLFVKLGRPCPAGENAMAVQATAASGLAEKETRSGGGSRKLKERISGLLKTNSLSGIVEEAIQDKGVIKCLISLGYEKETVESWRAMEALGLVAREFSRDRMEVVRDTVRRLLWSMGEESGGIGWSAAEMLGEIIMNNPDAFSDIIPIVWSFREEEMFRAGVVRAMLRIASVRPDLVGFVSGDLAPMLKDGNPAVRGYAALVAGTIGDADKREAVMGMIGDGDRMYFYRNGELTETTVGEVASKAFG